MTRLLLALFLAALPLAAQTAGLEPGIAHYTARRWTDAHTFFTVAAKAQPKSAAAAYWLGKTLMAENKPGEAEDWFDKATQLDPRSSEYHLWLARAIGIQATRASVIKQPFLARRIKSAVDKAVALDADNIDAREMRWQFYAMAPGIMGGGDDKARDEAAEIMRRNRYRGQFIAVQTAARAKDTVAVERTLKAMAAEYPDSVAVASSYANLLAGRSRPAEAWAVMDAFQKRRPSDPVALYQIGRLALITGQQLDRGEEALKRYIALAPQGQNVPTLSNATTRLGGIHEQRGNTAAARAAYEAAIRLDARNEMAKRALAALKP